MSMIINSYRFGGGVAYDTDAQAWFNAIVAAGSTIQDDAKVVVNDFILALKGGDNYWARIDQLLILGGADTLTGALVAVKGPNATSAGAVNYNRKTGCKGGTTSIYISTMRSASANTSTNAHYGTYVTEAPTLAISGLLGANNVSSGAVSLEMRPSLGALVRLHTGTGVTIGSAGLFTGCNVISRSASTPVWHRQNGVTNSIASTSGTPTVRYVLLLGHGAADTTIVNPSDGRQLLYSTGPGIHTGAFTLDTYGSMSTTFANAMAALS